MKCLLPLLTALLLAPLAGAAVAQVPRAAPQLVLNPVAFGADPAGVADSSPAFAKLMAAVGTNRQIRMSRQPSFSSDNMFGGNPDWSAGIAPYTDETGTLQTRDFHKAKP